MQRVNQNVTEVKQDLPTAAPPRTSRQALFRRPRHPGRGHRRRRHPHPGVLPAGARRRRGGLHLAGQGHHRYTGATAPTSARSRSTRSASPPSSGAPRRTRPSASRSRSRPTTAAVCSRISRAPSPRAASTSSPPRSRPPTRTWCAIGSCFEVPDVDYLETILQRIRRIDTVYDAYRVTPH